MARRIVWSPRAANGLEEICTYIARDSEHYACVFAQRIVDAVEDLVEFPEMGRVVPEYNSPSLRERIVGNYRIVYRLHSDAVQVVVVTHGSRLLRL
jgi:toxin ParE1/3/4